MAPNKFENHIKKELEEREIKPSSDAWSKLSDRLDETVIERPKKKGYFWYAVAASFIGLVMLSFLFFQSNDKAFETDVQIVDSPKKTNEVILDTNVIVKEQTRTEIVKLVKDEKVEAIKTSNEPSLATEVKEELALVDKNTTNEKDVNSKKIATNHKLLTSDKQLVAVQTSSNELNQFDSQLKNAEELIDTKILEILEKVGQSEDGTYDITNLEVDSLLRQVQEEILADSKFNNWQSIDATALLLEVEDELDPTFRDRIFKMLENKLMTASVGR